MEIRQSVRAKHSMAEMARERGKNGGGGGGGDVPI